jgi:hypothetical protein
MNDRTPFLCVDCVHPWVGARAPGIQRFSRPLGLAGGEGVEKGLTVVLKISPIPNSMCAVSIPLPYSVPVFCL